MGWQLRPRFRACDFVDNSLHNDHLNMDVAGDIGKKLGNEVGYGCRSKADSVALGAGFAVGFAAGDIEIADFIIDCKTDQVGSPWPEAVFTNIFIMNEVLSP